MQPGFGPELHLRGQAPNVRGDGSDDHGVEEATHWIPAEHKHRPAFVAGHLGEPDL